MRQCAQDFRLIGGEILTAFIYFVSITAAATSESGTAVGGLTCINVIIRNACAASFARLLSLSKTFASLRADIASRRTIVHLFGSNSFQKRKPIQ